MRAYMEPANSHMDREELPPDLEIVFLVQGRFCVITSSRDSIPGFIRIPLQVALSFAHRDGVTWISPDNSARGRDSIKRMREDAVSSLSVMVRDPVISALTGIDIGKNKKGLMDVQRSRTRKRERIRRWEEG